MSAGFTGIVRIGEKSPEFAANFSIDGHSHIQSGATAPLPLIWKQMEAQHIPLTLSRRVLDVLSGLFLPGGRIQRKDTLKIADDLVKELERAYSDTKITLHAPYKTAISQKADADNSTKSMFTPCIIMPMDMDYAHLGGFPPESTTIYHEGVFQKDRVLLSDKMVDGVYYNMRESALTDENDGTKKDVSKEHPDHGWVYQTYYKQYLSTIESVKKYPWTLIPMFHYDPRRWCNPSGGEMDKDQWVHGSWDYPFQHIATSQNSGVFIGFKMYPPLGYRPFDSRLRLLENFYARCENEQIPILTHCSPGGMTTHEAEFYKTRDSKSATGQTNMSNGDSTRKRLLTYDPTVPLGYFFDEYVHPKNWRPVLEKFPNLKLCLAHFGGSEWDSDANGKGLASDWVKEIVALTKEFPNVYTDVACYDIEDNGIRGRMMDLFQMIKHNPEYKHLQDKLIFGVDWYLSLITKAPGYRDYVEGFFDVMGEFDQWQWYRSALVNPATFYGLDNQDMIVNMYAGLSTKTPNEKTFEEGYKRIMTIKEQVETIRKELKK